MVSGLRFTASTEVTLGCSSLERDREGGRSKVPATNDRRYQRQGQIMATRTRHSPRTQREGGLGERGRERKKERRGGADLPSREEADRSSQPRSVTDGHESSGQPIACQTGDFHIQIWMSTAHSTRCAEGRWSESERARERARAREREQASKRARERERERARDRTGWI